MGHFVVDHDPVLAAVLGIWLAPEQIEVIITMLVGITGVIGLVVSGHVKTDIEAIRSKYFLIPEAGMA